jgi:hypothetical protein
MTPCNLLDRATVSEESAAFIFGVLRLYFYLTVHVADSSERSVYIYQPTGLHMKTTILIDTTPKISNFTSLTLVNNTVPIVDNIVLNSMKEIWE